LHHSVLDRWSRGGSLLHARDPRVKFAVLLAYLVALATAPRLTPLLAAAYLAVLVAAILAGRLPLPGVLWRAAAVLPFSAAFAVASALAGDTARAAALLLNSYVSAAAVLVLIGTTPLPRLLRGLESLGAPRFLTLVVQFVYRCLFVISEQVQHMRLAALARASQSGPRGIRWRAAAGALATLFTRSQARAEGIHHAMLARGFKGGIVLLERDRIGRGDLLFLGAGLFAALALRLLP
jgi:cobalt/nickel transport system permease protein